MSERTKSSMDCIITRLLALGAIPVGFAALAFMAARRIFVWSPRGATLWGIAAALTIIGLGFSPCKQFLEAGDHRTKEPHEVGRFVVRLLWLHVLGALGLTLSYVVLAAGLQNPRLAFAGAVCACGVSYLVFMWIFFQRHDRRPKPR